MSTLAAQTTTHEAAAITPTRAHAALRRAQAALYLGAAAAVALAAIESFATTTSGDGKFQHAGDYLLTGDGIPYMLALLTLLPALRTLQQRRDGRLGQAGIALASLGAVTLLAMFVYGLIDATGSSLGPTYILAALATIVGVALCAVGAWRARLLPRWIIPAWIAAWTIGSALPIPGPRRYYSQPSI
jgi:hypothetical protein